ncbi:hypothetical protein PHYBLDRAFT_70843 [Phycomyces blakesleeanus NRRL 1555(-)]|uniref:FAR1 domain-containing protein n=1 Tax=Phycomyces blakesleeanus (strain ATCC 8743b / DSM 1359 / FGSC 10004 / NBRC 33097 / NRRL 1555) TaxID=763407 RepID=A0A162TE08_PHYB8|nr:hypothetical protein PHYBLDRAFT_70843 [Phycomyces blakesleeanus NRRL 1555(-)]OAD66383.1 hypothetical protein PHYBLDRAFT_70843 [Phycomyces blakesleeanus NRRL 1555(-)]|eukprot:XP_018284423.1 hypothetical protein PHYBLDRAFT_70843 [Phycomyces blakesleeanus NRRL 1555(-)]
MSNINNTNDYVTVSETSSKKYNAALTEFNSIFLVGREFSSTVAVREATKAYGAKHNIALTTYSSLSTHIRMIYKHYVVLEASVNQKTPVPGCKRERVKDTQKSGCPCFIYALEKKDGKVLVHSCETNHNHPIVEDHRAYALYRKLSSEAMILVTKHLEDNNNDIENIKQHFGKSKNGKEMFSFTTTLQDLDFYVRYTVGNSEENKISMVFFVHKYCKIGLKLLPNRRLLFFIIDDKYIVTP